MSNILIRTLPLGNGNYGGILQAWALQQALKELGATPVTDESRAEGSVGRTASRVQRSVKATLLRVVPESVLSPQRSGVWQRAVIRESSRAQLNSFVDEQIDVTRLYGRRGKLRSQALDDIDLLLVGSDQVWRQPYGKVTSYMFDFATDRDIRRASYAASFGRDDMSEYGHKLVARTADLAHQFDAVSVREDSAVRLCAQQWGVEATQHVDPTMLLHGARYAALAGSVASAQAEPYTLSYVLDERQETTRSVEDAAHTLGHPIRKFMPPQTESYREYRRNPERYSYPSIEEWLGSIRDAQFVITDSFHGTVFSILFNKPFLSIANVERGASRFTSLLALFGLEDRLTAPGETHASAALCDPIDWQYVNSRIEALRMEGRAFLASLLG